MRRRPRSRLAVALAVLPALSLLPGCESRRRPLAPEFDLRHPSASRRLAAVGDVAKRRDRAHVGALFDRLLDDDGAVRLAAAAALRDLVGRDPGYRADADEGERTRAAQAWRASVASDAPRPSSPSPGGAGYTGGH